MKPCLGLGSNVFPIYPRVTPAPSIVEGDNGVTAKQFSFIVLLFSAKVKPRPQVYETRILLPNNISSP